MRRAQGGLRARLRGREKLTYVEKCASAFIVRSSGLQLPAGPRPGHRRLAGRSLRRGMVAARGSPTPRARSPSSRSPGPDRRTSHRGSICGSSGNSVGRDRVEVEATAVEEDRRLEMLSVAEAVRPLLDRLDLRVQPLADRVRDRSRKYVRMFGRWRFTMRAAAITGASRLCVARKYHRRTWRSAHPCR
jgi:hypothetical protein